MRLIYLYLLLCTCQLAAANVVSNQAAALVNPAQLSSAEQTRNALAAVVSKKSGLPIKSILNKNLKLDDFRAAILRSYYEQPPTEFAAENMWFSVVLDEEKLKSLLLSEKIPVWPDRRGGLFVWVVEEYEGQELVNAAPDSEVYYWLTKWFEQKGIPATFYNYEANDILDFQPRDVRFLNPDLIDFVTENYESSASMFVFVSHNRNGFSYRYGLSQAGEQLVIKNLKFVDLASGLESLASDVQAYMSKDQQVFADEFSQSTVAVKVNNIENADQMLLLMNYFDNHALIDKYHINQLSNGQISAMMEINVLPDTFVKFVEKEKVINHLPLDLGRSIVFSMSE